MTNNEELLWESVLNNGIDESLKGNPDRLSAWQDIVNARKFIQCEDFSLLYHIIHDSDPEFLVGELRKAWVEIAACPGMSNTYRRVFNPHGGGASVRSEVGRQLRDTSITQPVRERSEKGQWL